MHEHRISFRVEYFVQKTNSSIVDYDHRTWVRYYVSVCVVILISVHCFTTDTQTFDWQIFSRWTWVSWLSLQFSSSFLSIGTKTFHVRRHHPTLSPSSIHSVAFICFRHCTVSIIIVFGMFKPSLCKWSCLFYHLQYAEYIVAAITLLNLYECIHNPLQGSLAVWLFVLML